MNTSALEYSTPFSSFWMGGFECSSHRGLSGRRMDVIAESRHDTFAREDYTRLAQMGMQTARDGLRWHLIETSPGRYDFSSVIPMIHAAHESGVQVIWDLCHYGWPDDLDIFSPDFAPRMADFARAFCGVLQAHTPDTPILSPFNEPSFFSWAAGDAGFFYPFKHGVGYDLKVQAIRAAIAACAAILEEAPHARLVHTDPIINIVARPEFPEQAPDAEHHRQAQFQAWDMISGRARPELGGQEKYLDIIGANYYINNQWRHPGGPGSYLALSDKRYKPIWQILQEVYERYNRPIFIAETGIEGDARPAWLRYIAQEARTAIRAGVPLLGLCLYPIVNHPGWDDDRHCHNGLWDYADENGARSIYEPLAHELQVQQEKTARLLAARRGGSTLLSAWKTNWQRARVAKALDAAGRAMEKVAEAGRSDAAQNEAGILQEV